MSKLEATNVFSEGLISDLNAITTPNNVLTNALNATLITMNGNEFVLQNDLGNGRVETAKLPTGFVPLGVKEYGGIIYVASYNPITKKGQLGSFPSPERNLTQDEIGNNISISKSDFSSGNTITTYYKRIDVMPEGMYLNPGDKFGLFITGSGFNLLSYYSSSNTRAVTFHPAILDDYGTINYIDEECKVDGVYRKGLIFGSPGDLSSVGGYRNAFDKLLVYKGKKSGKLVLIVELETLDDFVVSRSISSDKKSKAEEIGSSIVKYSDDDNGEKSTFKVKFNNSGWPKPDNNYIDFTGIQFEYSMNNGTNSSFTLSAYNDNISYSLDGFTRDNVLKYKITPYTQLGKCEALARTGIINFNLFGTGNIIMTEWRYYVENNKIRINYGFDTNLLEGESVKEVKFTFYDVYYNKLYSSDYICGSTISNNYNGNYSEVLNLPYDLNYQKVYDSSYKNNKKYIYDKILSKDILKPNELLKNNLYCVKISITTTGLNSSDKTKSFFRFMWTTDYFNEEYIRGNELNFSVLQVPEKYIPKFSLNCNYDTDSSDFQLDYLNNPTQNGDISPFKYSATKPTGSEIRSNMYQDWKLSKASITLVASTKIDNPNSLFGDYNDGWFDFTPSREVFISYDNNSQIINTPNGQVSKQSTNDYINLISPEEPLENFKNISSNLSVGGITISNPDKLVNGEYKTMLIEALRNKTINNSTYTSKLEKLNKINDTQFYYYPSNPVTSRKDSNGNPKITINNIQGRLTRRVSGDLSDAEYTSIVLNELRPCIYQGMNSGDLQKIIGGASYNPDTIIGSSGKVILIGGDANGNPDIYAYWGNSDSYINLEGDVKLQHLSKVSDSGTGLSHNVIVSNLNNSVGNCCMYIMQSGMDSDTATKNKNHGGYLGVGFYTSNNTYEPYTYSFRDSFKEDGSDVYVFKSKKTGNITSLAFWKTSGTNEYAVINFGSLGGYSTFKNNLVTLLKSIHMLYKNVNRELWSEKLVRTIYHGIFPTKVNIGYNISVTNGKSADITKVKNSPIKLYNGDPFDETTVKAKLKSATGWKVEEDLWYKSMESLKGTPNVMQCSYLNIPYAKINSVEPNNTAVRETGLPVDLDFSNLTSLGNNKYLIGVTLDLGTQIDVSAIIDSYNSYLSGTSTYKPTVIYVPNGNSYKLIEGIDSLGNPLTDSQVYYLSSPGIYVAGNTTEASNVDIFGSGTHCNLKNLFLPYSSENLKIPVLNVTAAGSNIEKISTNIGEHNNRKHISDINYYKDVYFSSSTKPLK